MRPEQPRLSLGPRNQSDRKHSNSECKKYEVVAQRNPDSSFDEKIPTCSAHGSNSSKAALNPPSAASVPPQSKAARVFEDTETTARSPVGHAVEVNAAYDVNDRFFTWVPETGPINKFHFPIREEPPYHLIGARLSDVVEQRIIKADAMKPSKHSSKIYIFRIPDKGEIEHFNIRHLCFEKAEKVNPQGRFEIRFNKVGSNSTALKIRMEYAFVFNNALRKGSRIWARKNNQRGATFRQCTVIEVHRRDAVRVKFDGDPHVTVIKRNPDFLVMDRGHRRIAVPRPNDFSPEPEKEVQRHNWYYFRYRDDTIKTNFLKMMSIWKCTRCSTIHSWYPETPNFKPQLIESLDNGTKQPDTQCRDCYREYTNGSSAWLQRDKSRRSLNGKRASLHKDEPGRPRIFKLRVVSYKTDLAWRIDDAWRGQTPGVIQIIADYVVGEESDPMKLQLMMDLDQLERSLDQHSRMLAERKLGGLRMFKNRWRSNGIDSDNWSPGLIKMAAQAPKEKFPGSEKEVDKDTDGKENGKLKDFMIAWHPIVSPEICNPNARQALAYHWRRKLKRELYEYQKRTIEWAIDTERKIERGHRFVIGARDLIIGPSFMSCKYLYDDFLDEILPFEECKPRYISYKGGIIADDKGLGKTFTVIGLVAADSADPELPKFASRMGNEMKWREIPKVTPLQRVTYEKTGTLVICPNTEVCQQWVDQIKNYSTLSVFLLSTKPQHKNGRQELLEADVVVVSSNFLNADHYSKLLKERYRFEKKENTKGSTMNCTVRQWEMVNQMFGSAEDAAHISNRRMFIMLDEIKWRRVVLDKGHNIVRTNLRTFKLNQNLKKGKNPHYRVAIDNIIPIEARSYWYVSATPISSREDACHVARLLRIGVSDSKGQMRKDLTLTDYHNMLDRPIGNALYHTFRQFLFSRNTKKSIGEENELPKYDESVQYLDFHPIERLIYEMVCKMKRDGWKDKAFDVCSDVFSVKFETFWGILCRRETTLTGVLSSLKSEMRNARLHCARYLNNYSSRLYRHEYDYFETEEQLKQKLKKHNLENTRLAQELMILDDENLPENIRQWRERTFGVQREFTESIGTKLANVLEFVQRTLRDCGNRIIIFSQHTRVLKKCERLLKDVQVPVVWCQGNVHVRAKALEAFQSSDSCDAPRVLMLSILNSAAGANLTKATHVLLLDPVRNSEEDAYEKEIQAVRRAIRQAMRTERPCQIVRFVVRNTLEQEVLDRNRKMREDIKNAREEISGMTGLASIPARPQDHLQANILENLENKSVSCTSSLSAQLPRRSAQAQQDVRQLSRIVVRSARGLPDEPFANAR